MLGKGLDLPASVSCDVTAVTVARRVMSQHRDPREEEEEEAPGRREHAGGVVGGTIELNWDGATSN